MDGSYKVFYVRHTLPDVEELDQFFVRLSLPDVV